MDTCTATPIALFVVGQSYVLECTMYYTGCYAKHYNVWLPCFEHSTSNTAKAISNFQIQYDDYYDVEIIPDDSGKLYDTLLVVSTCDGKGGEMCDDDSGSTTGYSKVSSLLLLQGETYVAFMTYRVTSLFSPNQPSFRLRITRVGTSSSFPPLNTQWFFTNPQSSYIFEFSSATCPNNGQAGNSVTISGTNWGIPWQVPYGATCSLSTSLVSLIRTGTFQYVERWKVDQFTNNVFAVFDDGQGFQSKHQPTGFRFSFGNDGNLYNVLYYNTTIALGSYHEVRVLCLSWSCTLFTDGLPRVTKIIGNNAKLDQSTLLLGNNGQGEIFLVSWTTADGLALYVQSHKFTLVYNQYMTHDAAESTCASQFGSTLATISSAVDNNEAVALMQTALGPSGKSLTLIWMGLSVVGAWKWASNYPSTSYTPWTNNIPPESVASCAAVTNYDDYWRGIPCSSVHAYMCDGGNSSLPISTASPTFLHPNLGGHTFMAGVELFWSSQWQISTDNFTIVWTMAPDASSSPAGISLLLTAVKSATLFSSMDYYKVSITDLNTQIVENTMNQAQQVTQGLAPRMVSGQSYYVSLSSDSVLSVGVLGHMPDLQYSTSFTFHPAFWTFMPTSENVFDEVTVQATYLYTNFEDATGPAPPTGVADWVIILVVLLTCFVVFIVGLVAWRVRRQRKSANETQQRAPLVSQEQRAPIVSQQQGSSRPNSNANNASINVMGSNVMESGGFYPSLTGATPSSSSSAIPVAQVADGTVGVIRTARGVVPADELGKVLMGELGLLPEEIQGILNVGLDSEGLRALGYDGLQEVDVTNPLSRAKIVVWLGKLAGEA